VSEVIDPTSEEPAYEEVSYDIEIEYEKGISNRTVQLTVSTPDDTWTTDYDTSFQMSPGTSVGKTIKVTPGSGVDANEDWGYKITIQATSPATATEDAMGDSIDVFVKVRQFYRIEIEAEETEKDVSGGKMTVNYRFTVINRGNGADDVSLDASGAPSGWEIEFEPSKTVTLNRGEAKGIILKITSPENVRTGDRAEVTIEVESRGGDMAIVPEPFKVVTTVEKDLVSDLIDLFLDIGIILTLVIAIIVIAIVIQVKMRKRPW
jgi:uncharacterized membrane protein